MKGRNLVGSGVAIAVTGALVLSLGCSLGSRGAGSGASTAGGAQAPPAHGNAAGGSSPTSESAEQAKAPTKPTAPGKPMARVYQPPAQTVAMIEPSTADPNVTYSVTFEPYGPAALGEAQLVVRISKSIPSKKTSKTFDFKGRNAVVLVAPASKTAIKTGGRYTAVLRLVPRGGLLVPELDRVRRAQP